MLSSFSSLTIPLVLMWSIIYGFKVLDIMGQSVLKFYRDIFTTFTIKEKDNATYLFLIPKCRNIVTFKNFRSIGLCNNQFKSITKIIANRIKPPMDRIIGQIQVSFLSKRRSSNNSIVVQELISYFSKMKGKNANLILKIDLE